MSTDGTTRRREVIEYRKRGTIRYIVMSIVLAITCVFACFTITQTDYPISLNQILEVLSNHIHGVQVTDRVDVIIDSIIWDDYLPRAVGSVCIGVILGVGGAVMQTVMRNPMTDAYTTGISSGAMFGATLFVILGITIVDLPGNLGMVVNAFVFSLVPCMMIISISVFRKVTPTMMILIGIGMMYLFSAFTTLIKFTANPDDLETIFEWSVGTLGNLDSSSMPFLIVSAIVISMTMMLLSNRVDVMSAGDNVSKSLGVDPLRIRVVTFIIISICTSAAVCFSGSIGFVGLIVPHMARRIVGSRSSMLIPCSAILGALLLTASDFLAKNIVMGGLPVGVITALIGSPIFLYLLTSRIRSQGF